MKPHLLHTGIVLTASLLSNPALRAQASNPRVSSWFTTYSGKYARIYANDSAKEAGVTVTTWSNGSETQSAPSYCGVQQIYSSSNWVYIRSSGLGSHVMGPWYLNAARTTTFPNLPVNTKVLYRLPLNPTVGTSNTLTGLGAIGYFVDGVAMFDSRDGYVYANGSETANGSGYWNRDAYVNESVTFDAGNAHQQQTGTYHYHANPPALRYLLGDHVNYNAGSKTYTEDTNTPTKHSPIIGWMSDGLPLYGPYGYSNPTNPASGIRRMISGYMLRNGQNRTDNLAATGRNGIPAWAGRLYNVATNQAGPPVSSTYPLGRYMEDNAYMGDLGYVQGTDFDLDEFNCRYCVTPEFPNGTNAYFVSIQSDGTPAFPYNIGRAYYGQPTGGNVSSITEAVTTNLVAGPDTAIQMQKPVVSSGGTVTLVWNSVEGGTYQVQSNTNLTTWSLRATNIASTGLSTQFSTNETGLAHLYRIARTDLAAYDSVSGSTTSGSDNGILSVSPINAARGTSFTLTINLDPSASPSPPPQNAPVNSITVGTISGTRLVHVNQTEVTATIDIPSGASTGPQTVSIVFPGPPSNPTQTVTYTLANGFTVQ
jgi:hypothetical protein